MVELVIFFEYISQFFRIIETIRYRDPGRLYIIRTGKDKGIEFGFKFGQDLRVIVSFHIPRLTTLFDKISPGGDHPALARYRHAQHIPRFIVLVDEKSIGLELYLGIVDKNAGHTAL